MKEPETPQTQRLQKLIAAAGLASRRAVEQWIHEGRITVNGRVAKLGDRATLGDEVCLDGKPLALAGGQATPQRVLMYHKPIGEVTTRSDPPVGRTGGASAVRSAGRKTNGTFGRGVCHCAAETPCHETAPPF